jgi:hypothetical protein
VAESININAAAKSNAALKKVVFELNVEINEKTSLRMKIK